MSLIMAFKSGCCCCNNTAPNCNCLASSISVDIPAWSYGSYSCTAQTVIAYKCCYTYGDTIFTYRATAIHIGTTYSTRFGCSTLNLNTYFVFFIKYSNASTANYCNIFTQAFIVTEDSFREGNVPFNCYTCVNTPLVIDASTACYGINTNNLCNYANSFEQAVPVSYFSIATNCFYFLPTECPAQMGQVTSSITRNKSNTNCSKPNRFLVKFGTTEFTMTIS